MTRWELGSAIGDDWEGLFSEVRERRRVGRQAGRQADRQKK